MQKEGRNKEKDVRTIFGKTVKNVKSGKFDYWKNVKTRKISFSKEGKEKKFL